MWGTCMDPDGRAKPGVMDGGREGGGGAWGGLAGWVSWGQKSKNLQCAFVVWPFFCVVLRESVAS